MMDVIFEALSVKSKDAVIRLSSELLSELWGLCLLGPLACTNLRAGFADRLYATDSSLDFTAGVGADASPKFAVELRRRSLKKGFWSKLLPADKA